MSLVDQLQAEAIDRSVPINDLLRKAKVAAAKLKRLDLSQWLEHELSGYPPKAKVPEYRIVHTEMKFLNPYRGWRPIVGGNQELQIRQAVSEILSLLDGDATYFTASVSDKIHQRLCDEIGFACEIKRHISRTALVAIVDVARNNVLDWSLKLEEAGVHGQGMTFSKVETEKAKNVTINIGNIGTQPASAVSVTTSR